MSLEKREKKLLEMSDEDIDFSDIPELDEKFFKTAKVVKANLLTEQISIILDKEVLDWFKSHNQGKTYQAIINDVLRTYIREHS